MCINEDCDHPEGMLDRDLRTTKSSLLNQTVRMITNVPDTDKCSRLSSIKNSVKRTRSLRGTCSFRNLCHHLRKSFHKLKQAITILLCLSYAVGIPTTSSLPINRSPRGTMASTDQNPAHKQLLSIFNTARSNAYHARNYYNTTFVESETHPNVTLYEDVRFNFFFEHTLKDFKFPNKSTFDATVLNDGKTVKEFTKIFYDCFLRYNASMDMIGEENMVRNQLKVLLEEFKEYIVIENIEPLKEKYEESDVHLDMEVRDGEKTKTWLRNMIIYRDFAMTMEYVKQAYEHFCNAANNEEASV